MKRIIQSFCLASLTAASSAAHAQFLEPNVQVLRAFQGGAVGDNYGWACESMDDIDGDGVRELLISAVTSPGYVDVYSGATGALLNRATGTVLHGYAINDAGDVNADGVADYIIGGIPVTVHSGADHSVLLNLTATTGFGHGVAGAGDIDGDGYGDVIVGSERILNVSEDGKVFVISVEPARLSGSATDRPTTTSDRLWGRSATSTVTACRT